MSSQPSPEILFASFVARVEAGEAVEFESWVKEHRDHEGELRRAHAAWQSRATGDSQTPSFFARGEGRRPQAAPGLEPGKVVGDFRLMTLIGQGGMGQVWEARQLSLNRRVALKFVRPERITQRQLDYFGREARAGARLAHPGIVAVHGFGEDEGIAWIAMELVEGCWSLRDFLDDVVHSGKLPEHYDRLAAELIARIARAMHAAHKAGVLHRDLKPENVLVTRDDKPKVTDFGLARITDESAMSQSGDLAGTYYYMSPEQVAAKRSLIDHRTDVFSLGVVMYEMLTLQRPFQGDTAQQVTRKIQEQDPLDMRELRSRIPRDLAVICGRALEKDQKHRYSSMAELAADIERYMSNEPIHAKPPTTVERLVKWTKRNPTKSAAALVAALAFVVISVLGLRLARSNTDLSAKTKEAETSALQAQENEQRARHAEEQARNEAERAKLAKAESQARSEELEQVAEFQAEQLSEIDPEQMGVRLRRALLDAAPGERREALTASLAGINFTDLALGTLEANLFGRTLEAIDSQFADQPLVRARLLQTVASTLVALGLLDAATAPQEQALSIRRSTLGDDHPSTLDSTSDMGFLLVARGRHSDAESFFREALDGNRRILGDDHPDTLVSINNLGSLLHIQGKLAEAEPYFREALEGRRRVLGDDAHTLASINNMGGLLQAQGKLAEAEPFLREALEGQRRVMGDDHPNTWASISNMGVLLAAQGKLAEAERFYREAIEGHRRVLGDDHPGTLVPIHNLGALLQSLGRLADAEPFFREAIEGRRRVLGDDHPNTLASILGMGLLLQTRGRLSEAEPFLREALKGNRRVLGDDDPNTLQAIDELTGLLNKRVTSARPGGDGETLGKALASLGALHLDLGNHALAEPLLAEATEALFAALPEGPLLWQVQSDLGMSIAGQERHAEAEPALGESAGWMLDNPAAAAESDRNAAALGVASSATVVQRMIDLYDARHALEPGAGHDGNAQEWRGAQEHWLAETDAGSRK